MRILLILPAYNEQASIIRTADMIRAASFPAGLQQGGEGGNVVLPVAVELHGGVVAVRPGIEIARLHRAANAEIAHERDAGHAVLPAELRG